MFYQTKTVLILLLYSAYLSCVVFLKYYFFKRSKVVLCGSIFTLQSIFKTKLQHTRYLM